MIAIVALSIIERLSQHHQLPHTVEILAVAEERLAQHTFLHGADLDERAVAAAVQHGRARLEAMNADRVEDEFEHEPGAFREDGTA